MGIIRLEREEEREEHVFEVFIEKDKVTSVRYNQ
jgi:hypothetical protein